ncbi:isoprenylcysteine carboxylmethyltransferase family protein [bacterium]|nr:isoprenylcysteine carboxylmethyltransferase family protein [bacterium]
MSPALFLLYLLNLAFIGLLPRIFFKRGKFHWLWWLTAAPFLGCAIVLTACFAGYLTPWPLLPDWLNDCFAVLASVFSMSLISYTLGTHRSRLALWHQRDEPESIVTYGAYRYIRHPFYTAFLLALLGAVLLAPHPGTLFTFLYGFLILNYTASREEKFLSESTFGEQYREYRKRTGRFLPWFM